MCLASREVSVEEEMLPSLGREIWYNTRRMDGNMAKFPKITAFVLAVFACRMLYGGGVDFHSRPLLAGKASLERGGFIVSRTLGVAAFAPELRFPVEIAYDSVSAKSGIFGHGWHSPQLESSLKWDADGLVWVSPWGETMKFFPKKLPKGADYGDEQFVNEPHVGGGNPVADTRVARERGL